jgi:coenzyme F420-0:L-glutamate ligase / coenzyme F420-1:gamma-L-glutamate ligase
VNELRVVPVEGVPEVSEGDDVAALIVDALAQPLIDRDVLVVTQKVVSKAEGRIVDETRRDEVLSDEAARVLRRVGGMVIAETRHGFVCANAGIDASNVDHDKIALLPLDPDASARRIRARIAHLAGADVGVVVSDTFGRAWRVGQTDVAIGVAGFDPFVDYRGTLDANGRVLTATQICVADEIAGAAELVMGKATGVCAAVVRGAHVDWGRASARTIVRARDQDLFR